MPPIEDDFELDADEKSYFEAAERGEREEGDTTDGAAAPVDGKTAADIADGAKTADAKDAEGAKEGDQAVQDGKEPKLVPLKALHEEREARRALADELKQQGERYAKLEGRLQELGQRFGQAPPQQQDQQQQRPPSVEEDPVGAIKRVDDTVRLLAEQQQAQQQEREFVTAYGNAARQFSANQTDFGNAYQHLMAARDGELQAIGFADPAQRAAIIANEERSIAIRAFREGVNPAERIYALAKARGYAPPAAEAAATPSPAPAAAGGAVNTSERSASEKVAQTQRAQEAARSLSGGGSASSGGLTLDALAEMSEEEFAKVDERVWEKLWTGG